MPSTGDEENYIHSEQLHLFNTLTFRFFSASRTRHRDEGNEKRAAEVVSNERRGQFLVLFFLLLFPCNLEAEVMVPKERITKRKRRWGEAICAVERVEKRGVCQKMENKGTLFRHRNTFPLPDRWSFLTFF